MPNQTISITPADIADPTLLYRALSRITEVIDELKGYRGEDTATAKAELAALLASAKQLKDELVQLAKEFDFKLNQQTPKSLQDLADEIETLDSKVVALTNARAITGLAVTLVGAGSDNPTTSNAFNVSSVTRLSAGNYRVLLSNSSMAGRPVLAGAQFSVSIFTAGNIFCKATVTVTTVTTVDVLIYKLALDSTPALIASAYDLTSSDRVDIVALLYPQ